jgi:hypothetical protein
MVWFLPCTKSSRSQTSIADLGLSRYLFFLKKSC